MKIALMFVRLFVRFGVLIPVCFVAIWVGLNLLAEGSYLFHDGTNTNDSKSQIFSGVGLMFIIASLGVMMWITVYMKRIAKILLYRILK